MGTPLQHRERSTGTVRLHHRPVGHRYQHSCGRPQASPCASRSAILSYHHRPPTNLIQLALAAFNGVYCVARGRRGLRVLITPLWGAIAISWWAYYFELAYGEFRNLGLNIPATGSADVTWRSYQLIGAAWGWGAGLYLAVAATVVLATGGVLAIRLTPIPRGTTYALGFHSVGLLLLAILNLVVFVVVLPLVGPRNPAAGLLAPVPSVLLFVMAFLARRPKLLIGYSEDPISAAVPRSAPVVPAAQNVPVSLRPGDQEKFCFSCGKGIPEGSLFCPTCGANANLPYSSIPAMLPASAPVPPMQNVPTSLQT